MADSNSIGISAGVLAGTTAFNELTNTINLGTVISTLRFSNLLPGRQSTDPSFKRPSTDLYKSRGSLSSPDLNLIIPFQFNPTEMEIMRKNIFEDRSYEGSAFVEPIWVKGGAKTIRFKLTFVSTSGARMANVYGGTLEYASPSSYNKGFGSYDNTVNSLNNAEAASNGTTKIVEAIEALTYPIPNDIFKPRFINSSANITLYNRFTPLPKTIFCFGSMYLVVKIDDLNIQHKAFNERLNPVITDLDITLKVLDGVIISKSDNPMLNTPVVTT
jgi:hypothetical protein